MQSVHIYSSTLFNSLSSGIQYWRIKFPFVLVTQKTQPYTRTLGQTTTGTYVSLTTTVDSCLRYRLINIPFVQVVAETKPTYTLITHVYKGDYTCYHNYFCVIHILRQRLFNSVMSYKHGPKPIYIMIRHVYKGGYTCYQNYLCTIHTFSQLLLNWVMSYMPRSLKSTQGVSGLANFVTCMPKNRFHSRSNQLMHFDVSCKVPIINDHLRFNLA